MADESETLIFGPGEKITVKEGYQAHVQFKRLKATATEVLEAILKLDRTTARVGDLKDIQDLARAALGDRPVEQDKHGDDDTGVTAD